MPKVLVNYADRLHPQIGDQDAELGGARRDKLNGLHATRGETQTRGLGTET